jgi:hypothetical protein
MAANTGPSLEGPKLSADARPPNPTPKRRPPVYAEANHDGIAVMPYWNILQSPILYAATGVAFPVLSLSVVTPRHGLFEALVL